MEREGSSREPTEIRECKKTETAATCIVRPKGKGGTRACAERPASTAKAEEAGGGIKVSKGRRGEQRSGKEGKENGP